MTPAQTRSPHSSTSLLAVEHLGRKLDQRWLWRGVSFELKPQMRLGLVGPSGAGKTLLFRALVNLDPIDEGNISLAGRSLSQWSLPDYRKRVLYLPQQPALFEGTVEHNLKMVFQLSVHQNRAYERSRILIALETLGRGDHFLTLSATQLSGGESQILSLLRALQLDPQILLLDEPTASLDPDSTRRVEVLLERWLQAKADRACIWTSHDPEQIHRVTGEQLNLQTFNYAG
ncbi:MAG: ATP-binding cassette domain-containing protein [Cyanophyceae cyanobacterium]